MEGNPVNNNSNKGLVVLVIFLTILVIGLGGFIFYDKVLKDESTDIVDKKDGEENSTEIKEEDKVEIDENKEYVKNQIKVDNYKYNLNGKEHVVSLVYSYEDADNEYYEEIKYNVYTTIAFDGKLIDSTKVITTNYEETLIDVNKINLVTKDDIKIMKGLDNKDYLVVSVKNNPLVFAESIDSSIFNDKGELIKSIGTSFRLRVTDETVAKNYEKEFYITENEFYYITDEKVVGETLVNDPYSDYVTVQEYKVTISDNVATETPTKTYIAIAAGQ
jgi:hypothetical protein